jgi:hypothetical protein
MDRSAPKTAPLSAFIDVEEDAALPPVDRSTLERYAECPAKGRIIDIGLTHTANQLTNVGSEVHAAIAVLVEEYVACGGEMKQAELMDVLNGAMHKSRPDVQPEVIEAMRYSAFSFCRLLNDIHPINIVRYDGGRGARSGQLSQNLTALGLCYTSEVDLLYAGPAKTVLHEIDYKSGHLRHSVQSIRRSFQFQSHWWLVAANYPDVQSLEVQVFNTRTNDLTSAVEFTRDDLPAIESRIMLAAMNYKAWHQAELVAEMAWPAREKCRLCDGARHCPIQPPRECAEDPAAFVNAMLAVEAKYDAMREEAIAYVEASGEDIVTEDGVAFGFDKPTERKRTAALYQSSGAPARKREPRAESSRSTSSRRRNAPADDSFLDAAFASLAQKNEAQGEKP